MMRHDNPLMNRALKGTVSTWCLHFGKTVKAKHAPARFKLDTIQFVHFSRHICSTFQTKLDQSRVRHDNFGLHSDGEGCCCWFTGYGHIMAWTQLTKCCVVQCTWSENFMHWRGRRRNGRMFSGRISSTTVPQIVGGGDLSHETLGTRLHALVRLV
jgi:hypothetical protein